MDRARIRAEVIEIIANKPFFAYKLPMIPANGDEGGFDYERTRIKTIKKDDGTVEAEGLTDNPLDLHETTMELEDAFGISFDDRLLGDDGLELLGEVIAVVVAKLAAKDAKPAR